MTDDLDFQESLDRYFEIEAAELLQTIEQTLFSLVETKTIERVHTLMRAAHTIKGGAANCGFKTIETIAHHLEDVFQALYPPELEIDPQLGLLLMEGYDCLYDPLSALLAGVPYDEAATLERTAALFARLQDHLGDFFGRDTPLPTAAELGFDVIGSIFTDSIPHDLADLAAAIASQNTPRVHQSLNSLAEFLLELGGSYSLPGITAIAKTTLAALELHPARVLELAPLVLTNFQQARIAIVGGDRSVGGEVSSELAAWTQGALESRSTQSIESPNSSDWLSLVTEDSTSAERLTDITTGSSSEWLSLIDDSTETLIAPTAASEWLSLIDDSTIENNSLETVVTSEPIEIDLEIVEISDFEPEAINLSTALTQTEYLIEAIEFRPNSELALTARSGVDRIFQSIWSEHPASSSPEDLHQSETHPTTEGEAQPALISVRVATIQLERLSHTIGELLIDDNQQDLRADRLQKLARATVKQYRRCEQKLRLVSDWADKNTLLNERAMGSTRRSKHNSKRAETAASEIPSQFDRLELDVYSDLSILLQNLTDDITKLGIGVNNLAEKIQKSRLTLNKRQQLLAEAQSALFEARMVEISGVLNRFPRLLQQMVASHRKPAQLQLIGSTVSIDKIIAEKLYDPLLHLVRNAYDHGIESPEVRATQGKSATGQLTIKVYHQGNRTKIEVSDDGQGLNWTKIRQRAIDLHLLAASNAANATEAELAEIMFVPGFSTAEKVNDLSGRGIGLDVVRDRLSALQGTIDVRSSGSGTTFIMQFPLNLTDSSTRYALKLSVRYYYPHQIGFNPNRYSPKVHPTFSAGATAPLRN